MKVYCDVHYYETSSGCSTYCLARDNIEGHCDCNDITGARVCHSGWQGSYCNIVSHVLNIFIWIRVTSRSHLPRWPCGIKYLRPIDGKSAAAVRPLE